MLSKKRLIPGPSSFPRKALKTHSSSLAHRREPRLFPSALETVSQQVEQGICDYLSSRSMLPFGPNTVNNIENKIFRKGHSSLEIEARLGLLKSISGRTLFDESLITPAILQSHMASSWKFVPSLSRKSFQSIKNFVKGEIEAVKVKPSMDLRVETQKKIRQSDIVHNRIEILPNRDTIDMFYHDKLRVSYSSESCEPICALQKHSAIDSDSLRSMVRATHRECEVLQIPEQVVCLLPHTKIAIRFCVAQEDYLPLSKALDDIRHHPAKLKAVRHKKCNSVTIGNIWRIDFKRVAWWSINNSLPARSVRWFLHNSPLNTKLRSKTYPAHVTHEVEIELSSNIAESLYLDGLSKRRSSSRLIDLVESYIHSTRKLAMVPEEYRHSNVNEGEIPF